MLSNEYNPFWLSHEIQDLCGPLMPALEALSQSIYDSPDENGNRINSKIVSSRIQEKLESRGDIINFYPSDQKGPCCDRLMILALQGWPPASYSQGKLDCARAIEILVQHVQGHCHGVTHWAVVITALWETWAYDKWRSDIDAMRNHGVRIVFLQLGPASLSLIRA